MISIRPSAPSRRLCYRAAAFFAMRLLLLPLLFPAGAAAETVPVDRFQGPWCALRDPASGRVVPLSPERSQYNVLVSDGFARIVLNQMFVNPIEAEDIVYVFPLPHEGSVHAMSMEYRDSLYVAEIYEKEEARRRYDSVKAQGGRAALLLENKPNVFQQRLANIERGDTAFVRVELSAPLVWEEGVYELALPTMVAPRYQSAAGKGSARAAEPDPWNPPENREGQSLQINVLLEAGYPVIDIASPTHPLEVKGFAEARELLRARGVVGEQDRGMRDFGSGIFLQSSPTYPNRDFVLRFRPALEKRDFAIASHFEAERGGFFALSLYPDLSAPGRDRPDLEVVLLIDVSGSQGGWPLQKEKEVAGRIFSKLRPEDRLAVLAFNTSVNWAFGQGVTVPADEVHLATAAAFVSGLAAGGGTELLHGVQAALSAPLVADMRRIYVFLTDGFITNEEAIFAEIRNHPTRPTVFTFGAGNNLNGYFLDQAAAIGDGFSTSILGTEPVEEKVDAAWAKIASPQLEDIQVSFGGARIGDIVAPPGRRLYRGSPYTVLGRYAGGGAFEVTLTGKLAGREIVLRKDIFFNLGASPAAMLPQIWAREKINRLLLDAGGTQSHKEEIIDLSREYQVLSPYTAFLAIKPQPVSAENAIGDALLSAMPTDLEEWFGPSGLRLELLNGFLVLRLPSGLALRAVRIFDASGREVFRSRAFAQAEMRVFRWDGRASDGRRLRPGRYFLRLETGAGAVTKSFQWRG